MKKTSILFFLLAIIICIGYSISVDKEKTISKLDDKMAPSDHLFLQRAYPNDAPSLKQMDKVRKITQAQAKNKSADKSFDNTPWTQEGPTNIGGRMNCVAPHPTNDDVVLVGASAGGVYRTVDGGDSWQPIGDEMGDLSISSIVFDPNNSDVIYLGTGDHNISGFPNVGDGIYKSTDGGNTWTNMGLTAQRIISRIVIDPTDSDVIYAACMGLPFDRNDDRGLYKSTNGGEDWEQILFVSDESGIIDLVMNPANPQELYACNWTRIRNNHESVATGTEGHIFKTTNGGEDWQILDNGLPLEDSEEVSRMGLAMSQSTPGKVFSLIVGDDFQVRGIYRLDVGATEWTELSIDGLGEALGGFGWFFGQIRVHPEDDDKLYVLGVDMYASNDGGESWFIDVPEWWTYEVHADKHDLAFGNDGIEYLATDGGLYTRDGDDWFDIDDIPNSQFYRIAVNPAGNIYAGGMQDNGTSEGNLSVINDWPRLLGGDGFQPLYHPDFDEVAFGETQNGNIRKNEGGFWGNFTDGILEEDRRNWDMPIIMSSHDPDVMYTGTYRMYKNTNPDFANWEPISPSLTGDVIDHNRFHTITTIAESPVDENVLYSGSVDAKVYRTINGGGDWTEISAGLPVHYVTNIKCSATNAGTVYVSHSGYKENDNTSHLHKSTDYGDNWVSINGDLPNLPINHIEVFDEDRLVVATDVGVYVTSNGGINWNRVGSNMPVIPVFDLEFDYVGEKLVAGTFARSIMTFPTDSLWDVVDNIEELENEVSLSMYPNPANDYVTLKHEQPMEYVSIYDLNGKLVKNVTLKAVTNATLDISDLKAGAYVVKVNGIGGETLVKK